MIRNGDASKMFAAGAMAGAVARTATAPLDRIKLLFQVQAVNPQSLASYINKTSPSYTGLYQAASQIFREEGVRAFWKGNGVNVARVLPYSSIQLASNDAFKRALARCSRRMSPSDEEKGNALSVPMRLLAGACAGMMATSATHPIDTLRLRLAMPGHPYSGATHALTTIAQVEGVHALYRGLAPALVGIAPYAAINFASYDVFKQALLGSGAEVPRPPVKSGASLGVGALSGTLAATVCYPLDTVRRQMQMQDSPYSSQIDAFRTIWKNEGWRGFYRGWSANTIKVVPQNAIRLMSYEVFKSWLGVQRRATDT
jgi:solute carrier family 25 (mitochondrial phosphate transporter), member 23/24/25/41